MTLTDEKAAQEQAGETPGAEDGKGLAPRPAAHTGIDRFDEPIVVTRSRAWIGLGACLLLAAGVVAWSMIANVGKTIKASGVVLVNGSIVQAESPIDGNVDSIEVHVGEYVKQGLMVATITDPRDRAHRLFSPTWGYVLDIPDEVGSRVHVGDAVMSIAQRFGPHLIRTFLPPTQAQQLHRGTEALIGPPGAPQIHGQVETVGKVPLTQAQVSNSFGSEALAKLLVPSEGGVVNVVVGPMPGHRFPQELQTGGIASLTFVIGSQHPIDYVF